MVATLVLQRDENGDPHDPGGHLCNAEAQKIDGQGTRRKLRDKDPEEAKRLIENLMSSKSSKNLDMHRIKSAAMDSDTIVEAEIG
ncbi:hypothetical protein F2Q69_00035351 [Brassica cretica]|uniref:Uncharacterized protein n=1 Tax=Brassica cretica TaxID=69181 RepID=A0A8S9SBX2_BRACR|nr:hypothetical protein F2Q69_00035351 [Brassica cretica]